MAKNLKPTEIVKKAVDDLQTFKTILNTSNSFPGQNTKDVLIEAYTELQIALDYKSLAEVFQEEIYTDAYECSCAFLYLVQEDTDKMPHSADDLANLLKLESEEDLKNAPFIYNCGREFQYDECLQYLIRKSATYKELQQVTPDWFCLPAIWANDINEEVNQQYMLDRAIGFGCNLEQKGEKYLNNVAKKLDVDLAEIVRIKTEMFDIPFAKIRDLANKIKTLERPIESTLK